MRTYISKLEMERKLFFNLNSTFRLHSICTYIAMDMMGGRRKEEMSGGLTNWWMLCLMTSYWQEVKLVEKKLLI